MTQEEIGTLPDNQARHTETPEPALDLEKANSRVKMAMILAIISASLTTLLAVTGFFVTEVEGTLGTYLDPWLLFDAAIIWALAYSLHKRSFAGSIALVVYWVFSMFMAFATAPGLAGIFVKFYFLYGFINGVRGTYAIRKANPKPVRSTGKKIALWAAGSTGAALVTALFIMSFLMETGVMPSYEVESHASMPDRQIAELREKGILLPTETIDLFYSAGVADIMEDGNIVTDQRVISYWTDEEEKLQVIAVPYPDISRVNITQKGDALNDTVMTITQTDGGSFNLIVTVEGNGDNRFYQSINRRLIR